MQFKTQSFGGTRPIITGSAQIGVVGGFNLDQSQITISAGKVIPAGSLAEYDEETHLVTVLKASRVTAIDVGDAKIVSLESDEFFTPIFELGESVLKTVAGTFAAAPTITKIVNDRNGFVITLSAEISGLAVGDALFQVIADSAQDVTLPLTASQGLTIPSSPLGTEVNEDETSVDVTTSTKGNMFYLRRIPPIPAKFITGVCLNTNSNVQYTNSH